MNKSNESKIDLTKYLGKWHEIASFPAWFSKGCRNATAEYTPIDKETIEVKNTCTIRKQKCEDRQCKLITEEKQKIGKAFTTDQDDLLKVQFFPLVKAPYKIEYIDKDKNGKYQNAIVGSTKKYLWILSRKEIIPEKKYNRLKQIAKEKGYDINRLIETGGVKRNG